MKFSVSILEYLGIIKNGILVLLSIVYDNQYYEATFYYTESDMVLTTQNDLEDKLGYPIEKDEHYLELLKSILKQILPYSQAINELNDLTK